MNKFWDWLMKTLPLIWGVLWVCIITVGSVALLITVAKWLLNLLGVL